MPLHRIAPAEPMPKPANRLRIIGGAHRGRRLGFPDLPGLRPTGDRVRETLFNWLQPWLPGARCLDLFAGSGALGLEAASRGAAAVTLVEQAAAAARSLQRHVITLNLTQTRVIHADALAWLRQPGARYDLAFLDPPFDAQLHRPALDALLSAEALAPDALIYLERARKIPLALPDGLTILKEKHAGEVYFCLLQRNPEGPHAGVD